MSLAEDIRIFQATLEARRAAWDAADVDEAEVMDAELDDAEHRMFESFYRHKLSGVR